MAKADTPGHTSPYGCGLVAGNTYTDKAGRTWIVNAFLSKVPAVRGFYYVEDPNGAYVDVLQPGIAKSKRTGCSGFTKALANYRDCKNKRCARNLRDTGYNKNGACDECAAIQKVAVNG